MTARFGSLRHLVVRFVGSLATEPPSVVDDEWAEAQCLPGESALWRCMSAADRRHGVAVGRRAAALLSGDGGTDRVVLAAAILHDVGKTESGLGTFGRVGATVAGLALKPERFAGRGGRVARYLHHDELGAELLARAGSDPFTVAWAREHHLPPALWTVPAPLAQALKEADDD